MTSRDSIFRQRAALALICLLAAGMLRADEARDLLGRGEALYQAGKWKDAAEIYAEILSRHPNSSCAALALYSHGWALYQTNEFASSLADYRAFLEKYPEHDLAPECRLKSADCMRQLKRFDEALRTYDQLGAACGRLLPEALAGRGWVFCAQLKFEAAQTVFREAAQVCSNDARAAAHLFNAGNAALEGRQPAVAAELFTQVQQQWPTNALARPALYWQAVALFRQERLDDAAAKLDLLRQVGVPTELAADAALLLAQVQDTRHRYLEAAVSYAAVVTNFPGRPPAETAALALVTALEKAGDLPAAGAAAATFVRNYPANSQRLAIRFLIGEYRYRLADYAGAAAELEKFAADNPTNDLTASALHKAGWCWWNLKQPAQARKLFAQVVAKFGKSPLAVDAAFMQARAAEEGGDAAGAFEAYAGAVRLGRDGETAHRAALALIRLDQAARRYDDALTKADAFLASHADGISLAWARLYRGDALLALGRLPEALRAYQEASGAEPAVASGAGYGMAWVLRRQGRHLEAAGMFDKVAAGASAYAADAMFWAARSHEDAGQFDAASVSYANCLQQTPPSPHADEAAYRQAYCLWQTRKPDDAERLYNAVIQDRAASPFAANALYDLAWVMLEQGKKPEARRRFEEFARLYPKHLLAPDAHFRIGELVCEQEEFATAAAHYETAAAAQVAFRDKALFKLAWTREKLARKDEAAQTYLRLARQFPRSEYAPEASFQAGEILHGQGRFDDARVAFAAVGDSLFSEKAACRVADCWRATSRHAEAIETYGQVLSRWPQGACRLPALLGRGDERRALGAPADALADYDEVAKGGGETREAAQAALGAGYCWFALKNWELAARSFLKVDVLFGFEDLKPEALTMAGKSWEQAGDAAKAAMYRADVQKRYPKYHAP